MGTGGRREYVPVALTAASVLPTPPPSATRPYRSRNQTGIRGVPDGPCATLAPQLNLVPIVSLRRRRGAKFPSRALPKAADVLTLSSARVRKLLSEQ